MSTTKVIAIGSIPTYRGMYDNNATYYMQNRVCYKSCIFSANTNNFSGLPPLSVNEETGVIAFANKSYWTCIVDNVELYNRSLQFGDLTDKIKELNDQLAILKSIIRYRVDIQSDLGAGFGKGETHTLNCSLMFGDIDKSDEVELWTITRSSGDSNADAVWATKEKVKNFNGTIDLVWTDSENDLGSADLVTFTVTAYGNGNAPITGRSITVKR
jgi:hypothetical protein